MPIFEYSCRACGERFEELVRGQASKAPTCPACASVDTERLLSLPRVRSDTTRAMSMRAAKRRDQVQANEREYTQRQYELNHDDH